MPALVVAVLTARDLVRRRIFAILVVFAGAMVLLSLPLSQLTIGQWRRLITDVGLGCSDLSLMLIAVVLGASLIAGDLDRRTLYPLLAKPISRGAFVVGKYVGLGFVLLAFAGIMGFGTEAMLWIAHQHGSQPVVQATIGIAVSALVVGATAILFSSFTSTTLAGIFSLAVALAGHLTDNLAYFGDRSHAPFVRTFMVGASKVLPNLERLNLKILAAHGTTLPWNDLALRSGYGLAYSAVLVILGSIAFAYRDLK
ncbi:MAG: ABC transporter permease [Myxococcales bacterium]